MTTTRTPSGVDMAYEQTGSGPPLVLLHGITQSMRAWDPLVPALAKDHTVVLVDLPGHGQSERAPSHDLITLANEVAAVVSALEMTEPLVVGHSLGGMVATAYAAMHPSRGVINVDQSLALAEFQAGLRELESLLRGDDATFQMAIMGILDTLFGALGEDERQRLSALTRPDQAVVLDIWGPVLEQPAEELGQMVKSMASLVTVPYLALHGNDPGEGYAAWLSSVIKGADVEVWPDLGHYPHLVEPDRFVQRVNELATS